MSVSTIWREKTVSSGLQYVSKSHILLQGNTYNEFSCGVLNKKLYRFEGLFWKIIITSDDIILKQLTDVIY